MTTATNDTANTLAPKDFLIKDYELKVRYLTDHFGRMWTRFNYFVGIESALIGGKLIFGNGNLSREVPIIGAAVSVIWYVMGAEDHFLVRVYRGHVKDAADLLAKAVWGDSNGPYLQVGHGPYLHVGEVTESSKVLGWGLSGWRWEPISTTSLAAWIPLLALFAWLGLLIA